MTNTVLSAMGGIDEGYLAECEAIRAGGLPPKKTPQLPSWIETLGYVALILIVLGSVIVVPGLLRRQPQESVGSDSTLGTVTESLEAETTERETTPPPVTEEPTDVPPPPAPVSASWNGKTVTIAYDVVSGTVFPDDMRTMHFHHGYAVIYDYGTDPENWMFYEEGDSWNYLDTEGNRLLTKQYTALTDFHEDGLAVGQLPGDEKQYVFLNTQGEEVGPATKDDFSTYWDYGERDRIGNKHPEPEEIGLIYNPAYDEDEYDEKRPAPYLLGSLGIKNYSNIWNGLVLFTSETGIGVMDTEGNVILTTEYKTAVHTFDTMLFYEDRFVTDWQDYIAIITVTVSTDTEQEETSETTTEPASTEESITTPPETSGECQHTFGDWVTVKQATCKDEGSRTKTCSKCSETVEESIQKSETHTSVTDAAVPATCQKTGLTEGSHCSVCNRILTAQKTISQTDHEYVNDVCTMCNHSKAPLFTPDYTAGQENTIGNGAGNSYYASQADWIYFASSETQISKFKRSFSSVVSIYKAPSGIIRNVNVVGDWLYFYVEGSNTSNSYIAKVRTDGSSFEKVLSSVTVGEMLVVKDTIFFTTIKNPYSSYAKDCAPLYSISVNGGVSKQLHDGYVSSMTADGSYVYFLQTLESGASTIYRIKHDGTKEAAIFQNANINYFVLSDAKLYFLKFDSDSDECTVASIPVNGGSQTTYGKIPFYSEWLYVSGNSVYYCGMLYSANEPSEVAGVIQFNTSTKTYTVMKEDYENPMCYFTSNVLIYETYDNTSLKSVSWYDVQSGSWRSVSIK